MRMALVIGTVLLAAVSLVAAAPPASPPDPTVARLSGLTGQAFDVAFMQALIPVEDEAIELAMTATLYADHVELLRWNQVAVERKNEQVRTLVAWLHDAGAGPAERRAGVATASVKQLRALRGAALERAYLRFMVAQLNETVTLARLATSKASRPELREFAEDTVRADGQGSATLRGWLSQWY